MDTLTTELKRKANELKIEQESLTKELREIRERLSSVKTALAGIEQIFRLEGVSNFEVSQESQHERTLAEFIKEAMSDHKVHTSKNIIKLVKSMGYDFKEKNPFRSVNFTLMGLQRGSEYERQGDGWQYVG
ncbi:hypothetical protein MNBD_GAMMA23-779 [hydrothermal vent metagenome]|uniref:Uncharacterized protein n=1 Tax=hydrothermal vent metagenome TaxID=652676 RepID=A0A3B0ZXZ6_9ZZZZ